MNPRGVTLQWIEADLSQPTLAANHIAAQAPADLDVLIHNLGIWEETAFSDEYAFLDESDAALTQLVDVNITATLVLLQRLLPRVLGAPRPQLVLTGSTSALPRSGRPEVAFGASKFALNGIADALREGFRDRRLAVTSLQLGYLNTDDALSVLAAEAAARGDGELGPGARRRCNGARVAAVVTRVRALLQLSPSGFVRELVCCRPSPTRATDFGGLRPGPLVAARALVVYPAPPLAVGHRREPAMDALSRVSAQVLDSALPSLPLYLLQATAVIGMIGVLLIATRRAGHAIEGRRLYVGVALGLIYLFNAWFVARYTQGVVKLHLGFDILLVSGMLGGWRGGLACLGASLLARYQFAGTLYFLPAGLEAALQMLAGVWLRRRLHPRMLNELSLRMILQAWGVRIAVTAFGLALGVAIIGAELLPVEELAIQRLLALPLSLLMLGAVFALVYNDAQIDVQRQREQAWLRIDPISGLPNMRALGERLQHFWRDNDGIGKACLIVAEMGNLRDLRLRYGPLQDNGIWQRDSTEEVHRLLPSLPAAQLEIYQFGDAALAILVRDLALSELRTQPQITELASNLAEQVGRDWPGFRPLFRCAVVELKPPADADEGHLPFRAITVALSAIESGVVFFDDPIQRDSEIDALIEVALERWLQQGDAPLCYQPKHRLQDRQLVGAEALLRMRDGEGRLIAPMRVISLLRRQGRLAELEWATLQSAIHFLQQCRRDGWQLKIAVNVSAESLRLPDFGLRLQELLQLHDVPGAMLRLEIVEWTEIVERDAVDANIAQLLAAEVTLSLDDFGAGYSTLILLSQLAIAEVKIEQALIATLSDAKSQSIVRFIVEVAHRCGAIVVAEGTETLAQEQKLRALGVDVGQGYLYSAALPADEFRRFAAS
ncbi:MAG: SDR family NAD(P)-dependent oxidoreductase [Stenotrophomonas maltophilia]